MKRFEVYRNFRKRAVIFGLPIAMFAMQMASVIASLLVIIFSFGFGIIIGAIIFNGGLYVGLTHFAKKPQLFSLSSKFPNMITNKRESILDYGED